MAANTIRRWLWTFALPIAAVIAGLLVPRANCSRTTISGFAAHAGPPGIWWFAGRVVSAGHDPAGQVIQFTGPLEGYTATVEKDGSFQLIVAIDSTSVAGVSARASDMEE